MVEQGHRVPKSSSNAQSEPTEWPETEDYPPIAGGSGKNEIWEEAKKVFANYFGGKTLSKYTDQELAIILLEVH